MQLEGSLRTERKQKARRRVNGGGKVHKWLKEGRDDVTLNIEL